VLTPIAEAEETEGMEGTGSRMENLRDVFMNELIAYAATEKRIVVLDPDVGRPRTWNFGERCPDRFYGSASPSRIPSAMASGLASTGCIVFASTFAVFASLRAAEMIHTSICCEAQRESDPGYAGISNGKDRATHQSWRTSPSCAASPTWWSWPCRTR
jgi:transketolase